MTPRLLPAAVCRVLAGPRHTERLFARYGDLVPDWAPGVGRLVWLRSPHLIEQVLRSPAVDLTAMGRAFARAVGSPSTLVALSGERHRTVRSAVMSTVRGDALAASRAAITTVAQRMADACPTGRPFRLLPLLERAVVQANIRTGAGIHDPHLLRIWTAAFLRLRRTAFRPLAVAHGLGLMPRYPPALRAQRDCLVLIREEAARRWRVGAVHDDALGQLMVAQDRASADESLTGGLLSDQLMVWLFAAYANSLAAAWVVERAVRQPGQWERVAAEATLADGDAPYTDAVIRESLRLRPPVSLTVWRLRESCDLGGHRVGAGAWIVPSYWDVHRHPDLYPDPEAFRPERFLDARPPRGAWLPFGVGPHACVGTQLALQQVKELLHALARRGHLKPAVRGDEGIGWRSGFEIRPARGCRVILGSGPTAS
ncbi:MULTISPECIES: cytochrome P450 [unclassified Streptomyces]|uniref:cytochrome P450 n=1 Tax=unclassified Streptomyces TaxID=2593676 RepID=UPI00382D0BAD